MATQITITLNDTAEAILNQHYTNIYGVGKTLTEMAEKDIRINYLDQIMLYAVRDVEIQKIESVIQQKEEEVKYQVNNKDNINSNSK